MGWTCLPTMTTSSPRRGRADDMLDAFYAFVVVGLLVCIVWDIVEAYVDWWHGRYR